MGSGGVGGECEGGSLVGVLDGLRVGADVVKGLRVYMALGFIVFSLFIIA